MMPFRVNKKIQQIIDNCDNILSDKTIRRKEETMKLGWKFIKENKKVRKKKKRRSTRRKRSRKKESF